MSGGGGFVGVKYKIYCAILLAVFVFTLLPPSNDCRDYRNQVEKYKSIFPKFPQVRNLLMQSNVNRASLLTTPEIIRMYGYPVESHKILTADGYILTNHRIPHGKSEGDDKVKKNRPVVYLWHGFWGSSFEWFMNLEHNILPLKLADAGYDVWLGNNRGNQYSRGHLNMTTLNSKFWQFSMDEMGKYDLPAVIDYLLGTTGQTQIYYIGFSMGTTIPHITMSLFPEYNAKVKIMIALAPATYLNHMLGFPKILYLLEVIPGIKDLIIQFTNGEFLPPWLYTLVTQLMTTICSDLSLAETLCKSAYYLMMTTKTPPPDQASFPVSQVPVFFGHVPNPTSVHVGAHLLQYIHRGIFRHYDFGKDENTRRYGQPDPPLYYLNATTVPVAIFWGPNDGLVNPVDSQRVASELANTVVNMHVNFSYWSHFDFHVAKDADELVNGKILELLSAY